LTDTVLGLNLTVTSTGIRLDDGACALVRDGACVAAIPEERLNRRKHSGGVHSAVAYCLDAASLSMADVDLVVVTTCCDVTPNRETACQLLDQEACSVPPERVHVAPSHHTAHAASTFLCSPFEEAAILVADNMGNVIGEQRHADCWLNRFERTTIFHGRRGTGGSSIQLRRRYGDREATLCLGAVYHYFTRWLGFDSYHESGQVMALAGFGTGELSGARLFDWTGGELTCLMPQRHLEKATTVRAFFQEQLGVDIGPARARDEEPTRIHAEVAWVVQRELERVWVALVDHALSITGARNVCLAGGVALNCVANTCLLTSPLLRGRLDGLFVQPASSDVGQALGNALWGAEVVLGGGKRWVMMSDALGKPYTDACIRGCLDAWGDRIRICEHRDPFHAAAAWIAEGRIIGWFQGGSELGPRALGHRSILGDPRTRETKCRLDASIKRRAVFRPYAPAILATRAAKWVNLSDAELAVGEAPLRMMLVSPLIREHQRARVPAIVHADGSARCQLVSEACTPELFRLITQFETLTGVPLVLNTSFNGPGEPIVESPADALGALFRLRLDALVLGQYLVEPA